MLDIKYAITFFMGWLQKRGATGTGLVDLAQRCSVIISGRSDCRVNIFPWNADTGDVAEYLWRYRPPDTNQRHLVVGYSYGGQTAINFCHALLDRGNVQIERLYLCDPVRRWRWLPGVAGLFGLGKLVVPSAVEHVWAIRRLGPRWSLSRWLHGVDGGLFSPAGHPIIWRGKELKTDFRSTGHSHIDDDRDFHQRVLNGVEQFVEK